MILKSALIASASLLALGLANAQDVPEDSAQSSEDARTLGTITVTAQKREENIQDVPISIFAYSGDTLADLGIDETEELGQFLPGLEIVTSSGEGSQVIVFLRGAGLTDFNTNNAGPIAIYSDEVYINSPVLTAFQFYDVERVEVLKGPQGTLYGRNSTGGAIKFVTNKPTEELEIEGRARLSEFNSTLFEGAISGPITDAVRGRLAFSKADSDGYGTNLVDGSDLYGVDTLAYRGTLDIDVTDNFMLRANLHGAQVDSQATAFNHLPVGPGGTDILGYPGTGRPFDGEYNRVDNIDQESFGGYLEANIDFGNVTLTSVTAYDEVDHFLPEESDASPLDILFITYGVESETITQELRLSGETERGNWVLGGFYLTEDLSQNQTVDILRELRFLTGGLNSPDDFIQFTRTTNEQETESWALFGQFSYDLTDKLTATVGARYTTEEKTFDAMNQLEEDPEFGLPPTVLFDFDGLSLDEDSPSWRVALDYKPNETTLIYGSIATGFKSGGFNGGFLSGDPLEAATQIEPYEPETVTAYEVGVKTDLADGRLRVNGSLFLNDFEDLQVFTLVNTTALPIQVLDNAGGAEVLGLEVDATAFPTDDLTLNLSVALLDSELTDLVTELGDVEGNQIANTPETSVTGLARYEFDGPYNTRFHVQGSAAYKSDQFFSTENNPLAGQEAYTLVNAQIGFKTADDRYSASLFATNLTDEEYLTVSADLTDFGLFTRIFGPPRVVGVELTAAF